MAEDYTPKKKATAKKATKKKSVAKKAATETVVEKAEAAVVENVKPVAKKKEAPKKLSPEEQKEKSLKEKCKTMTVAETTDGNIRYLQEKDSPQNRRRLAGALERKEGRKIKFFWNDKLS